MYTFQDFQKQKKNGEFGSWILSAINSYKASEFYQDAKIADDYARQKNTTIVSYQKMLYTVSGKAVPDIYSANHKCTSNFFNRFVTAEAAYSLGNGASFGKDSTKKKLGKDFDKKLYYIGKNSLIHGVCYGFFNYDHVEMFTALEFVPLYDEENGTLRAGIRFWQLDSNKPLRFTVYEEDGYSEYICAGGEVSPYGDAGKQSYVAVVDTTVADGQEIVAGENYPSFPIVPLWGNVYHQSEIIGIRSQIDAYDLIKSGFANDLDDVSQIYWILENSGGMSDIDLAKFVQRMKTVHAASAGDDDGATATAHTLEVPYQSREVYLNMLEKDMYRDYMALDVQNIQSGAVTATQIDAAYDNPNQKADEFELNVTDFVQELLRLIGIDDEVTFTRSVIVNKSEMITNLVQASGVLPEEYIAGKLIEILGDIDKKDEILEQIEQDELERYKKNPEPEQEETAESEEEVNE